MSLSRGFITKWLSKIDISNKNCLDIGAGPPDKWAKNFTHGKPGKYVTVDYNNNADYKIDLNIPIKSIPDDIVKNNQVTFCIECLEHLWNPVEAINNISKMTKEVCYITTPFINPIHDTWDYLRFTNEWFEKVMPMFGFKKIMFEPRNATKGSSLLNKFYQTEGLRMSKIRYKNGEGHKLNLIGNLITAYK